MFSVVMYSEENVGVEGNSDPGDTVLVIENHSSFYWLPYLNKAGVEAAHEYVNIDVSS